MSCRRPSVASATGTVGRTRRDRRGATAVEMAIIAPLTFLLLIGLIVAGLGAFRFQQIAGLAREGARWAAVHGKGYQKSPGGGSVSDQQVFENGIKPYAVGLDLTKLTYEVDWNADQTTVSVRVTYRWLPEAFMEGRDLASTSVMLVSY